MNGERSLVGDDDAFLAGIVEALVQTDAAIASLEAEKVFHLAAAMRVARQRAAHQSATVQAREMEQRSIAAEIAVATRTSDRAVQNRMHEALTLLEDLPSTVHALSEGRISARHARLIREEAAALREPETRWRFEEAVLEVALRETPARTQTFARRLAEELRTDTVTERFAEAEHSRRVWREDLSDGMSQLGVIAPSALIHGMWDRLTRQGKAVIAAAVPAPAEPESGPQDAVHDTRTLDQVRADLVCDLLLSAHPAIDPTGDDAPGGLGALRGHITLTVPVLTVAGKSDRGAMIDGTCPVDADTARKLVAGAPVWERVLTHPVSGTVLAVDTYRRTEAIKRFLVARDVHCRFPGCRQPARLCDHDHNHDWARGGPTSVENLACLCKRHHTLKTEKPWRAQQRPDGTIRWISPLGRTKLEHPPGVVHFRPDPPPPPTDPPF